MIPPRDASRSPVQFPLVIVSLIAVNVLAFVWEVGSDEAAIIRSAVVPAEPLRGHGWITPFTAMFLHGGVMPIVINMVFLVAPSGAAHYARESRDAHRARAFISPPHLFPAPAFSKPTH